MCSDWIRHSRVNNTDNTYCCTAVPINNVSFTAHSCFLHSHLSVIWILLCCFHVWILGDDAAKMFSRCHLHYPQIPGAYAQILHILCEICVILLHVGLVLKLLLQLLKSMQCLIMICQVSHDVTSMVTSWQISQSSHVMVAGKWLSHSSSCSVLAQKDVKLFNHPETLYLCI